MIKIYDLGKQLNNQIYYDVKNNNIICMKNNKIIELSLEQKKYLYKKFKLRIKLIKWKKKIYLSLLLLMLGTIKYHNVLLDIPEIITETKNGEEDYLANKFCAYIDRNNKFTSEQKDYLKEHWFEYLKDYGNYYNLFTRINMLNNIAGVDISYDEFLENCKGKYIILLNEIVLKNMDPETLFHETIHSNRPSIFDNKAIGEGFDGAVNGKYCDNFTYKEENEYLLLLSEIIGKEKVIEYAINNQQKAFYREIAQVTSTEEDEIEALFKNLYYYTFLSGTNHLEEAELLDIENRKQLALLAIKAQEENKNNFIVVSALNNTYRLKSSFLEEEYIYEMNNDRIIINEQNKYNIVGELRILKQ